MQRLLVLLCKMLVGSQRGLATFVDVGLRMQREAGGLLRGTELLSYQVRSDGIG